MILTRREWLAVPGLMAGAGRLAAQSTVHDEIRALAKNAPLRMQFKGGGAEECRGWQRSFAAKLGELLGPYQPPARWETITERTVELDDHRREELVLRAEGHRDLPVHLLTPRGGAGKRPAILALHGHGRFGYDPVAGVATTPELRKAIQGANYDYGLQLARRGYVVAAPCLTPFGRRLDSPESYRGEDPCGVTFVRMQLLGKVLMAENLRDALWSLELLASQDNVDAGRLGCVGLSYGGRMTMLTSALSPRVRAAVISGALNVMQERVQGRYGCGSQVIPGLLEYGDVPEISSLIAPRACLWETGTKDSLMVKGWLETALDRIRRAYRAFDALDRLQVDSFDGGHRWNGVVAYPFLDRALKNA